MITNHPRIETFIVLVTRVVGGHRILQEVARHPHLPPVNNYNCPPCYNETNHFRMDISSISLAFGR